MPQQGSPLSAEQIAIVKKWIDDGARWPAGLVLNVPEEQQEPWWSYQPIKRPAIPEVRSTWIRTPVDAFILRRQENRGLHPNQDADRRTLIRRLTFDLWGLPPTPEATHAFVNDPDPQAYEKLVDRLLASPRYGERWARHWLDIVRYADTCGYDKDKPRPYAWPYRDYVIRSFNHDKPYGRFVREQVAGDAIFPHQPDGILGLGFLAAGPWDFIGHVEVAESKRDGKVARNLDRDEMLSNVMNTFCSVTIQCARCHHHKFDPISTEQYYQLQSFFSAVDRANRPFDRDPNTARRRKQLQQNIQETSLQLRTLQKQWESEAGTELVQLQKRITEQIDRRQVRKTTRHGYHSQIASKADTPKFVELQFPKPIHLSRVVLRPAHDDFAGIGSGFGFPLRFYVEVSGREDTNSWTKIADFTQDDYANPGLIPVIMDGEFGLVSRVRVTATKLAERKEDFIFALAEIEAWGALDASSTSAEGKENWAASAEVHARDSIESLPRWGRTNLVDGDWPKPTNLGREEELAKAISRRDEMLRQIYTPQRTAKRTELRQEIETLQTQLKHLPTEKMVYAAAIDFPTQGQFRATKGKPRPIHVLHRGDVDLPGDRVHPQLLPVGNQN